MLNQFRTNLEQQKGARNSLLQQQKTLQLQQETLSNQLLKAEEARNHIQTVAKETQAELEFHISDIVTHALAAVFDNPYTFRIEFVTRRDKTEADMFWEKDGNQYLPNGGGIRDISALGLREAMRSLQPHQGANVLLLDEPTKHLQPEILQERVGTILQEIHKSTGLQIIMVTHNETILSSADKMFKITKKNDVSKVQII